jgi:hypothetical protein
VFVRTENRDATKKRGWAADARDAAEVHAGRPAAANRARRCRLRDFLHDDTRVLCADRKSLLVELPGG